MIDIIYMFSMYDILAKTDKGKSNVLHLRNSINEVFITHIDLGNLNVAAYKNINIFMLT